MPGYHGYLGGLVSWCESIKRLRVENAEMLIPAYGKVEYMPERCMNLLEHRLRGYAQAYVEISAVRYYFPEEFKRGFENSDFSFLPSNLNKAVLHSVELYTKTEDPQLIDITIDNSGFGDMKDLSDSLDCAFIKNIVSIKVDFFNILTFVRCVRMRKSEDFYFSLVCEGGKIPTNLFTSCYKDGLSGLLESLSATEYSELLKSLTADRNTAYFERLLEGRFNDILDGVKYVPYGAELIAKYLLTKEKIATNMRIILTAKNVGLSVEETRAMLRK